MRKPDSIVFWLDDRPPWHVAFFVALQQISFLGVYLVISPLFAHAQHLDTSIYSRLMAATLIVSGIGVMLQAAGRAGVGSGYFCPLQVTSATFSVMTLASVAGGLELAFGMVGVLGFAQILFGELFRRARGVFSVEVAGVAVTLIGFGLGHVGLQLAIGFDTPRAMAEHDGLVAAVTLGTMILFNVWFSRHLRMFSAFLGLLVGFVVDWWLGGLTAQDIAQFERAALFGRPQLPALGWRFDPSLIPYFVVVGLALSLHGFGALAAAQRFNDADWKRPDVNSVCRGIRAEGLVNMIGAVFNALPVTSSGGAVGLAAATGCTSRLPAYWLGGMMIVCAFVPKVTALWLMIPVPVIGAAAIFLAAFTVLAGMQMIASRMLDNRKILAVGLGLICGLSHGALRSFYESNLPTFLQPITLSSVALGVAVATALSAVFRLGVRTRVREVFDASTATLEELCSVLDRQGRRWGARPEVVRRAEYATWQAFETLMDHQLVGREEGECRRIEVETAFDEFTFTVVAGYHGIALPIVQHPPTANEMIENESAVLRMAGFLLQRLADRVETRCDGHGRAELVLTFFD